MTIPTLRNKHIAMVTFAIAIFFLGGCQNDIAEVRQLTQDEDFPLKVQYDVHFEYSDSARKQLDIQAPEAADYTHEDPPYIEFPQNIRVVFYDKTGAQEAFLKANYAKYMPKENRWYARGNVVVVNSKNEELNSEELIWNEKTGKIYSDKFVKIITDESILTGDGFEADQNFDKWVIKKSSGIIDIKEEELNETEQDEENETEENR